MSTRVAAAVAVLLLATGCGAQDASRGAVPADASATAAPVARLRVGLTEWTIEKSAALARPGRVQLTVTNAGATRHDLVVRGRLGEWHTRELRPGQQQVLVVRGRRGESLALWCAEPGHRAQGMHTALRVAG